MKNDFEKLSVSLAALDEHYATEVRGKQKQLAHLETSCREVGSELERLSVRQQEQQKAHKSRFNVFTALLKHDDEVKLHSRWLHHLLDPKAEHDCGTLFLDLFIKTLRQKGVQPHEEDAKLDRLVKLESFASDTVKVEKELHTTKHGNIDIHIESPKWGVLVIENKTKSGERDNQIRDYATYCIDYCRHGRRHILLFLTPDGRQAKSAGEHKDNYHRISYRDHILPWLKKCLRATYPFVHINQALQQYKNVVYQLIGRSNDSAYMKKVTEILKKHPAIIEHLAEINQAVDELEQSYWEDFVLELRKQLAKQNIKLGSEVALNKRYPYFELKTTRAFRWNSHTELKLTLEYSMPEKCLSFGVALFKADENEKNRVWEDKERYASVKDRLVEAFPEQYKRDYADKVWPLSWVEFLNEFRSPKSLADHVSKQGHPLDKLVADTVDVISRYLKVLEEAWPEVAKNNEE